MFWRSGQRKRAREVVDGALQSLRDPDTVRWLLREAASFALDEGDLEPARAPLEQEAELIERDSFFGPRRRAEIPLALGLICLEEGKLEEARTHF